jgi:hypothetical protein
MTGQRHEQGRMRFLSLRFLHQQKVVVSLTPQQVRQQ